MTEKTLTTPARAWADAPDNSARSIETGAVSGDFIPAVGASRALTPEVGRREKKNTIAITINYAGMQLPVVKNEFGEDCTPLKPIVDLFGLRWEYQREKVAKSPHLSKFLGTCTLDIWGAGPQKREETCILLSRVAAFIMSISPDRVRSHGNVAAADFLEQKIEEWADALHDYEELGVAINLNHVKTQEAIRRQRMSFMAAFKIKDGLKEQADRKAAAHMIKGWAEELGVPYQLDIADDA